MIYLYLKAHTIKNPIIALCVFLVVPVGQTYAHLIVIKLIFALKHAFLFVTVSQIKVTNALTYLQEKFMFLDMLPLMSPHFLTKNPSPPPSTLSSPKEFLSHSFCIMHIH